jgi:outer membrane protein
MQRLTYFFILLLAAAIPLAAQPAYSLEDCISYALANHPDIRVAQLQITDAEAQIRENKASGLPQVSAGLSYSGFIQRAGIPSSALGFGGGGGNVEIPQVVIDNFTPDQIGALGAFLGAAFATDPDAKVFFAPVHAVTGTASANQLIFSNSYLVAKRAARQYRAYVGDQMVVAQAALRNRVVDAYLPALLIADNVTTLDKNISNLEKLLVDTRAVNQAGFAEQLDVDRLELSIGTLRSERDNLLRQREIVINALKMTMGMPIADGLNPSDNVEALLTKYASADLTTPLNYMNRPEYVNLLKGRDLAALQLEIFERPWLPTVAGFVQWQGAYQGGFGAKDAESFNDWFFIPSTVGGISVSTTLWDSGLTKARKQRAQVSVMKIEEQKRMVENAFQLELDVARKQYMNAEARVTNAQKNVALAQRIYDTAQTKYRSGIGSSLEITQAEQGLYGAQQTLMTARYDLLAGRVAIRKALGGL